MNEKQDSEAMSQTSVVIVDDSPEVRFLLATLLENDGRFQVVGEAANAKAGIATVAEAAPDLVLVDLRLGRQDGLRLVRDLRSRHPRTTLALITGTSVQQIEPDAFAAGADSVHGKESMIRTLVGDLLAAVAARSAALPA